MTRHIVSEFGDIQIVFETPSPQKAKAIEAAFMNLYKRWNAKEIIRPAVRAEEPNRGPRDKWGRQK